LSGQQQVAALAAVVDACAKEGDEVAAEICRQAGTELARAVLAVVRRLPQPSPTGERLADGSGKRRRTSVVPRLFARSRQVREAFLGALRADATGIDVRPPRFEPIVGAVLLGRATPAGTCRSGLELSRGV
jgi:N-acetylglucosamine kinase-like BadF-type ATPase